MNNSILFVVEGDRDYSHLRRLTQVMAIKAEVVNVHANIYMLYYALKRDEFNLNITDVLLEMPDVSEEDKKMIRSKSPFTFTYLFFDLDPHHSGAPIKNNIRIVTEMLNYFVDETDNTIGKLYVNYPMVESLWDYDKSNIDEYRTRNVLLGEVSNYKELVGNRGSPLNPSRYSLKKYKDLGLVNVKKSNYIVTSKWLKPTYSFYLEKLQQESIFNAQVKMMNNKGTIAVLSSIPLFMVDYWGNMDGFYDSL